MTKIFQRDSEPKNAKNSPSNELEEKIMPNNILINSLTAVSDAIFLQHYNRHFFLFQLKDC